MRVLSNIRRLFVSEKRSKDLKPSRLMYGGDTWMPTFIFKSRVFKCARCLCDGWQFAGTSKKERGKRHITADAEVWNLNFAFWRADTHLASGLRSGVMFESLLLFHFDCVRRRYSLRSVDILTWAADKVSGSRRPAGELTSGWVMSDAIVIWTMAAIAIVYIIENDTR